MTNKKLSRATLTIGVTLFIALILIFAFWPKPTLVDIGTASTGAIQVTINEEATTRVSDLYVLSAPISGRLLRINLVAGDSVIKGETIVAQILPSPSGSTNTEQGRAALKAANAAITAANDNLKQAKSEQKLALQQAQRSSQQHRLGTVSAATNEIAQQKASNAHSVLTTAYAQLSARQADLAAINAQFIDTQYESSIADAINVYAPISGKVLKVVEESERVITAGTPIVHIGDVVNGLEVVVELLSSDAVQVKVGQQVLVNNWGGIDTLHGEIRHIEPLGFIKTSALGVEERRVKAIVKLDELPPSAANLGHGFRVDVAIVVWEKSQAIIVSSSALFREAGQWSTFVVSNNKAQLRAVTVEKNNGTQASITSGLSAQDSVILYPAAELVDGLSVAQR
ncbi:MAG: efflux RND transporter periplasmic adaptor subunit [Cognaticolwellia sp.]